MTPEPRDPGVLELLRSGVQTFAWAFRDLIGQQREWTPTAKPRTVTTSGNVNPLDDVILVDASASAVTVTLETAVAADGRQHTFKKIDAGTNAMVLDGNGSETIDGTADLRYTVQNVAVTVKSDGINWRTVGGGNAFAIPTSGVYMPTLTARANLDSAGAASECQFMRVGTSVVVSGRVDVDPTAPATSTELGISLPIASNFGAQADCGGVAFARDIAGQGAAIRAETSADTAVMQWISGDITNQPMFFIFMYEVI